MNPQPDLAAVCGKALAAIDGWLSDDDRALLRSRSLDTTPTLYGEILRRLPHDHVDRAEAAWLPIVKALGHLRHNVDDALDKRSQAGGLAPHRRLPARTTAATASSG